MSGLQQEPKEGLQWTERSASKGDANGLYVQAVLLNAGDLLPRDVMAAGRLAKGSAEAGNSAAQAMLAKMHYFGENGQAKSLAEAARWSRLSALAGNAEGQTVYAKLLFAGEGVAKDPREAVRWFQKAAALGDTQAAESLAEPAVRAIARGL